MSRKPGDATPEDFATAVRAATAAWNAFTQYQNDIAKAKVDMRILSKTTNAMLLVAAAEYDKLRRVMSIIEAEIRKQEGETH